MEFGLLRAHYVRWRFDPAHSTRQNLEDEIMKYSDPIGAMGCAMGGTTLCVAAKREMWAKPANGNAFAVHSIVDETTDNFPFWCIYVTDYRGKRYCFEHLTEKSQRELCDYAINERHSTWRIKS
jgi:hypothetical protein